jgi:hypothetical protein
MSAGAISEARAAPRSSETFSYRFLWLMNELTEEVTDMEHTETTKIEGTPEQLATWLERLPNGKRYRITAVEETEAKIASIPAAPPCFCNG